MSKQQTIWKVCLSGQHKPTGNTLHLQDGKKVDLPKVLLIVQIGDDPGYYLLYLDAAENELTDTYHDSECDAMRQAEFEFSVQRGDWIDARKGEKQKGH